MLSFSDVDAVAERLEGRRRRTDMVRHVAHIEISGAGDVVDAPRCDVVPVETENIDRGLEREVIAHPLGMMKQGLGSPGQEPILHLCYPGVFHVGSPSRLWPGSGCQCAVVRFVAMARQSCRQVPPTSYRGQSPTSPPEVGLPRNPVAIIEPGKLIAEGILLKRHQHRSSTREPRIHMVKLPLPSHSSRRSRSPG